jgi:glycosyltransferase involved in cell wall biosynthesis
MGIPESAFVVGHVGRLAPEKNLPFLATSIARFIAAAATDKARTKIQPEIHCLVIGAGPSEADIRTCFAQFGVAERLHIDGIQTSQSLADAYHAMDVFAFASTSETQGMVLSEAMAAGKPVVALDAPGVREIVSDTVNGRLLAEEDSNTFAAALHWVVEQQVDRRLALAQAARTTAEQFSMANTAERALDCYRTLLRQTRVVHSQEDDQWIKLLDLIKAEWSIIEGVARAAGNALVES